MNKKATIVGLVLITVLLSSNQVFGTDLTELQEQKKNIQEQIDTSNTQVEEINIELTDALKQVYDLKASITNYEDEISKLNLNLDEIQQKISEITDNLENLENSYKKQKKALETRLVALYEAGETSYLDVLLQSNSLSEFISNYFLISEITEYDNDLLNTISRQKESIATIKEELDGQEKELKIKKSQKERVVIALENAKLIKDSYIAQLTVDELVLKTKIDKLEDELDDVNNEISEIATGTLSEEYVGGEMEWPVPSSTTITSPFGMRYHPILKIYKIHTGVDIGAASGKDILAVNDGVVIKADYVGSYGNLVMIDHGGGIVTAYGHGSEIIVQTGDVVKRR